MAPVNGREEFERAEKTMEERARRREAVQQPENPTYERIMAQVGKLDLQSQLRLLEELAALVRQGVGQPRKHSILEWQGLGKEIWEGVDAQEYVDEERCSWEDQTPKS